MSNKAIAFKGTITDEFVIEEDKSDDDDYDEDEVEDEEKEEDSVSQVVAVGSNIITSCGNVIYWLESDGTEIRNCTIPDIDEIQGIAVDTYGNVYVSGYSTDNIFVVSQNAIEYRFLLDRSDGLDNPTAMVYDKKHILIAVFASKSNARAVVYNVVRDKK